MSFWKTISIVIFLASLIVGNSFAQKSSSGIRYIGLKNVDKLLEMIEDDEITGKYKAEAITHLAEIYHKNESAASSQAKKFIETVAKAVVKNRQTYFEVRVAGCLALGVFDNSVHAEHAISSMGDSLLTDSVIKVQIACAKGLGKFKRKPVKASKALLKKLRLLLKIQSINFDEISVMKTVVVALSGLKVKQSFIPLMKVMQSRYPASIKAVAEKAIEQIRWD